MEVPTDIKNIIESAIVAYVGISFIVGVTFVTTVFICVPIDTMLNHFVPNEIYIFSYLLLIGWFIIFVIGMFKLVK